MSYVMVGGGVLSIASGIFGSSKARRARKRAARRRKALGKKLKQLESNRQAIINPYAGITSLAGLATDLSDKISNPFANLSVATQAAEMKIEQSNIALANTLDTIRASGASAGGATALAQAALQAKQGVAASIEAQEKANEDKRAQGEAQMEARQVAEARRLQSIGISEGAREQSAQAQGLQFEFNARERRQDNQINRVERQLGMAARAESQARADQTSAITGMIGGLSSIAGSALSGGQ